MSWRLKVPHLWICYSVYFKSSKMHGFVGMIDRTDLYVSVALTPLRTSSLWSLNIINRLIFQLVLLFTELICRWQSYVIKDNGKQHSFFSLFCSLFFKEPLLISDTHIGDGCNNSSQVKPQVNVSNNHLNHFQSPTIHLSTSDSCWQRASRQTDHVFLNMPTSLHPGWSGSS